MFLSGQPQFFDPSAEYSVAEGRLPHWEQVGVVVFITFRTWDSLPREVVQAFLSKRDNWLRSHGIDPAQPDWEQGVAGLRADEQTTFQRLCSARWEDSLDNCHGSCPLRLPAHSKIVADSIKHFNGVRYTAFDFVVMPNHVHILASFPELGAMRQQCKSWKHFTATRLNKLLGRVGRFWEGESFDHLVRSEQQFDYLRGYIIDNPAQARLRPDEFVHYSRDFLITKAPLAERSDHTKAPPAERADHTKAPLAERADHTKAPLAERADHTGENP